MKEWKIVLTPEFKQEFKNIYAYVAEVLLVPETAKRQAVRILEKVEKLNEMPHKFSLVEKEPWRSRGLRKLVIDNYVAFYLINEKMREVVVLHIFYGGRNIEDLFKK